MAVPFPVDTVTRMNAWQPFTYTTLGPSPVVAQRPVEATNRFYRGALKGSLSGR